MTRQNSILVITNLKSTTPFKVLIEAENRLKDPYSVQAQEKGEENGQ